MTGLSIISVLVASSLPCFNSNHGTPDILGSADPAIGAAVAQASDRFAIPRNWIEAVIGVESGGDINARSPKGAMGLMQIMPSTWASLRLRYRLGNNPFDVHDNIIAGTGFLRELYKRFGASGFLAAYNAGSSRYISSLTASRPLSQETQHYLAKLKPLLSGQFSQAGPTPIAAQSWRDASIFAVAWSSTDNCMANVAPAKALNRTNVEDRSLTPNTGELFPVLTAGNKP